MWGSRFRLVELTVTCVSFSCFKASHPQTSSLTDSTPWSWSQQPTLARTFLSFKHTHSVNTLGIWMWRSIGMARYLTMPVIRSYWVERSSEIRRPWTRLKSEEQGSIVTPRWDRNRFFWYIDQIHDWCDWAHSMSDWFSWTISASTPRRSATVANAISN